MRAVFVWTLTLVIVAAASALFSLLEVWSLMYLAVCTRSDIAMGVSTLSRFCQDPGMAH